VANSSYSITSRVRALCQRNAEACRLEFTTDAAARVDTDFSALAVVPQIRAGRGRSGADFALCVSRAAQHLIGTHIPLSLSLSFTDPLSCGNGPTRFAIATATLFRSGAIAEFDVGRDPRVPERMRAASRTS